MSPFEVWFLLTMLFFITAFAVVSIRGRRKQ